MHSSPAVIFFANQKGGTGKSTLLIQFAVLLSQLGYNVEIIDADPQKTVQRWFLKREAEDIDGRDVRFEDLSIEISLIKREGKTDYVLVDTAGVHTQAISAQLKLADLVVIPVQPTEADIHSSLVTETFLKQNDIKHIFVINRAKNRDKDTMDAVLLLSRRGYVSKSVIFDRKAYARCLAHGISAWDFDPKTPCKEEVTNIWNDLVSVYPHLKTEKVLANA